jgi:predicted GH43/DUF377 family glycosyl hydrolase
MKKTKIHRCDKNPILTRDDIPFECNSVFNCGVEKFNGRYVMVLRIELRNGCSRFGLAWSDDGISWEAEDRLILSHSDDPYYGKYEQLEVYDPRITKMGDTYYILYAAEGGWGPRVGIAKTTDFKTFERVSYASECGNRNGVLFPEKINGMYAILDRPFDIYSDKGMIWISYSPDLIFWGKSELVMEPRNGGHWDSSKVGAGPAPIRTDEGWLVLYHGVKTNAAGQTYRGGTALLDLEDPAKVIARSDNWLMAPEKPYECVGDVPYVCFPTAAVVEDDGEVKIYYGGADTTLCLATARIEDLIAHCYEKSPR